MTRRVLFLATEDWFFKSHFSYLPRRAKEEGYDVVVAARGSGALEAEGFSFVDTVFQRGSFLPWVLGAQAKALSNIIKQYEPTLVHAIGLKSILLLQLSDTHKGATVLAVTGRGMAASGASPVRAVIDAQLRALVRSAARREGAVLLVENIADARWAGSDELPESRVVLMPGAGVDPESFIVADEPTPPPIVIGVMGRLVKSKGMDIAVEAVASMNARGRHVRLRIGGDFDPDNPKGYSQSDVAAWEARGCVEMAGRVTDINGFWAQTHIACVPSRGGEGLPRVMLEAAACGKPIVTTPTPGCADFVRHTGCGVITSDVSAGALVECLTPLVEDTALRRALGKRGRESVENNYTTRHAADAAARAWAAACSNT
jgi:glycosyltransferase involved in cell wall biosynthesis